MIFCLTKFFNRSLILKEIVHRTSSTMANVFVYSSDDFILRTEPQGSLQTTSKNEQKKNRSRFEEVILDGWDKAMSAGVFRYSLDELKSRRVPGKEGFILQLNLKRGTERRKPESIQSLSQAYDPEKFNFTKVKSNEILCELRPSDEKGFESNGVSNGVNSARHLVMINVSPLEYGHILLVPDVNSQTPQKLSLTAVKLALDMLLLTQNPAFRVGFNGLCALASVNHQHLHAWYLEETLKIESAEVVQVGNGVYEMVSMPTRALTFQLHGCTPEVLARRVFLAANYMQQRNIAHNLYMTRGKEFGGDASTVRVYLWPRKHVIVSGLMRGCSFNVALAEFAGQVPMYGAKNENISEIVFNVAVAELGGHVPMFAPELFDSLSEENIVDRLKAEMLPDSEFNRIAQDVADIIGQSEASS